MVIRINGLEVEAYPDETVLEVCQRNNISVPTLCYHPAFKGQGACRMCVVEVKNKNEERFRLVTSCTYPVKADLEVVTNSEKVNKIRRTIIMLLANRASDSSYIQTLCNEYNVTPLPMINSNSERCILCRLCVKACEKLGSSAIAAMFRGTDKRISTPFDTAAEECIGCKACAQICPTGAIEVIEDENKRIIWNKTFEMIRCERCGKPYATREQVAYINTQTGYENIAGLCEDCRKKVLTHSISHYK